MPGKNINSTAVGKVFNIKDYLEAISDASTRTRTVTIVLVISSVLIFIGFWNSFKSSWATERVRAAYDLNYNKYKMLANETHLESNIDKKSYEENLRPQVLRAYIDNVRFIKFPFFGIAIEVNDLGTIGVR